MRCSQYRTYDSGPRMDEEVALRGLASIIDSLSNGDGGDKMAQRSLEERRMQHAALEVLGRPPANAVLGTALVDAAWEAFQPSIQRYQRTMLNGELEDALQHLCRDYEALFPQLAEWCALLNVPDAAAAFPVYLRGAIVQPDLVSGEEPVAKHELMRCLRAHCTALLSCCPSPQKEPAVESSEPSVLMMLGMVGDRKVSETSIDPLLGYVHGLTLSAAQPIKALWREALEQAIRSRMESLGDDYAQHFIKECLGWKEEVVDPFVQMALTAEGRGAEGSSPRWMPHLLAKDSAVRAEVDQWCADFKQKLLSMYAQRRISNFWDVLVEYPDSIPALEDIRYCLQSCPDGSILQELIDHLRKLLASRLHRAGTRTEDILAMLTKTVYSLCVLLSRSEQSAGVLSVIADTLVHLRNRKDSISAIVQAMTQSSNDASFFQDLQPPPRHSHGGDGEGEVNTGDEGDDLRGGSKEKVDVLRVLLTAFQVKELVHEYQKVLASSLLAKPMHDFDTTPEEEVLERLKCVLGEEALWDCVVMVRDLHISRRTTLSLREMQMAQAADRGRASVHLTGEEDEEENRRGNAFTKDSRISLDVLSMTSWPKQNHIGSAAEVAPPPAKYVPHPSLSQELDRMAQSFRELKSNQKLVWLLDQGRITLEFLLVDASRSDGTKTVVTQNLSIFAASVVLHLQDSGGRASMEHLSQKMQVTADVVQTHMCPLSPTLVVLESGVSLGNAMLRMQTHTTPEAGAAAFFVGDDAAVEEVSEEPLTTGIPPEQIKVIQRMVTAMLKTRPAQSLTEIQNSLKMFGQFSGSAADLRKLLQLFINEGHLAMTDGKKYALPPA